MRRAVLILALLTVAVTTTVVLAQRGDHEPEDPNAEYRHKLMEGIRANMGAIGDIMRHQLPHQANIATHAEGLRLSSTLIPSAFKAQVSEGTEALPVIWEKWDDFVAGAKAMETASAALGTAAGTGDMTKIGPAVRAVGQTCQGCHQTFRLQKER